MKFAILLTSWVSLYGATLTISPTIIYDCIDGNADATLTWSGATGPGVYKLAARMLVAGVEIGVDSLTVRIE